MAAAALWKPSSELIESAHITRISKGLGLQPGALAFHEWSKTRRDDFWTLMSRDLGLVFRKQASRVLDWNPTTGNADWFVGAELNIVESCLRSDPAWRARVAIVEEREDSRRRALSFGELEQLVARIAQRLNGLGLKRGDAAAIDLPMNLEAVAVYLALVLKGCAVVSIADSFAPTEIETRLRIGKARVIFTQDVLVRGKKDLPLYEKVLQAGAPKAVVISAHDSWSGPTPLRAGDLAWKEFLGHETSSVASIASECVPVTPSTPSNILFSSGTTGDPKAIPWTHTTPIKCGVDARLHHNIHGGDILAWPTNLGWMMGPWLIYAAFLNGAGIALFDGAPSGRAFGEFVSRSGATLLGVVPSLVKTWRASQCMEGLDWSKLKVFSSTGECSNPEDMAYLMGLAHNKAPIIEYCGGTEVGGAYVSSTVLQECTPATFAIPAFGQDFVVLDDDLKTSSNGEVFLVPPSIGFSNTLLNRDHFETYYAGTPKGPHGELLRRHGDQIEVLPNGEGYRAHGRVDDTMNIGGIKVSSAEIERSLVGVTEISDSAAIAIPPPGGGPSLLLLIVVPTASGRTLSPDELQNRLQKAIRERLNPLFKIHKVSLKESLPRTASNKVLRRVLRSEYLAAKDGAK